MGVTVQPPAVSDRPSPSRLGSIRFLRPLAVATLVVNMLLVVTGGVVRLTGSGLGCPTWPRCSATSFVPHRALGIHGVIEFGNRTITFVLTAVAIATLVVAWRHGRPAVTRIALWLALGVPAQAVIGGISVLTDLNPWVVALHLLVSMGMIGLAVVLLRRLKEGDGPAQMLVPNGVAWLVRATYIAGWAVLYLGTVVTGSGPHAGAANAPRNGLDPQAFSQLHADLVFLFVGLTLAAVLVLKPAHAPRRAFDAAVVLLAIEVAQGAVGFAQYFSGLPVSLVTLHLLGAAAVSAAMTWLLLGIRDRA